MCKKKTENECWWAVLDLYPERSSVGLDDSISNKISERMETLFQQSKHML